MHSNNTLHEHDLLFLRNRKFIRSNNRYEFPLVPSQTAIIIIDVQEEFALEDEYYKSCLPDVLDKIGAIARAARESSAEVIFTFIEALTNDGRDMSLDYKMSGPSFGNIPGPRNKAKLMPGVLPIIETDILIPKTSCSVFNSTNIDYVLRNLGVYQVVIVGQLTDQCCESAVRDAADLGYLVTVASDAFIAKSQSDHIKGIKNITGFARILFTSDVIEELCCHMNTSSTSSKSLMDSNSKQSESKISVETMEIDRFSSLLLVPLDEWQAPPFEIGVIQALYNTLDLVGVKFVRIAAIDIGGNIRAKVVPLKRLISGESVINEAVTIAKCVIGMPSYADCLLTSTNLTAEKVLPIHVDFDTFKVLPYSPSTCLVLGNLHEQRGGKVSSLCTRSFLCRVIDGIKNNFGMEFNVGAELEFCLYHDDNPIGDSRFANSILLDDQELFISNLYDQLQLLKIDVELIHSESACGQLELVLPHVSNPLRLADNIIIAREVSML